MGVGLPIPRKLRCQHPVARRDPTSEPQETQACHSIACRIRTKWRPSLSICPVRIAVALPPRIDTDCLSNFNLYLIVATADRLWTINTHLPPHRSLSLNRPSFQLWLKLSKPRLARRQWLSLTTRCRLWREEYLPSGPSGRPGCTCSIGILTITLSKSANFSGSSITH